MPFYPAPGSSGGAPVGAKYIVQTADATLTDEQAMGALATGFVFNTTTTGVQSIKAHPLPVADGGTGTATNLLQLLMPGRLEYVNTTQLRLVSVGGGYVRNPLNAEETDISTALTLGTGGLAANTNYYIYLDTGTDALVASTTVPATTTGVRHKNADTGQLLVGYARTNASTQFFQDDTGTYVISEYHKRLAKYEAVGAAQANVVADATYKTLATACKLFYILVDGVLPQIFCYVNMRHDDPTKDLRMALSFDGETTFDSTQSTIMEFLDAQDMNQAFLEDADDAATATIAARTAEVKVRGEGGGAAATFDVVGTPLIKMDLWH